MYDEFDEKTMDEEKREAERAKRKRRRKIGFIIGIISAALLTLSLVLGAIALDHYWEEKQLMINKIQFHPRYK